MKINATQALVLSKFVSDDDLRELRSQVKPGEYAEDFMVRVQGAVKVGKDGEEKPRIGWKELAGWLLERVNPATRDALVRAYTEAKETSTKLEGGELAEATEAALDAWLEKHKTPRKGQVRGACTLTVIEAAKEAA